MRKRKGKREKAKWREWMLVNSSHSYKNRMREVLIEEPLLILLPERGRNKAVHSHLTGNNGNKDEEDKHEAVGLLCELCAINGPLNVPEEFSLSWKKCIFKNYTNFKAEVDWLYTSVLVKGLETVHEYGTSEPTWLLGVGMSGRFASSFLRHLCLWSLHCLFNGNNEFCSWTDRNQ